MGLFAVKAFAPRGNITYADIYVNDMLYEAVHLNKDAVIRIDQGDGKVKIVEVKDWAIFMAESTCSDHLCIDQGEMSHKNYEKRPLLNWIICLPNLVTVVLCIRADDFCRGYRYAYRYCRQAGNTCSAPARIQGCSKSLRQGGKESLKRILTACFLAAALLLSACGSKEDTAASKEPEKQTRVVFFFDTVVTVTIYSDDT